LSKEVKQLIKNEEHTPKFIVESDATIVAPLIFAWVLGW